MVEEKLIRQIIFLAIRLFRNAQLQASIYMLRPRKFFFHARKHAQKSLSLGRARAEGYIVDTKESVCNINNEILPVKKF